MLVPACAGAASHHAAKSAQLVSAYALSSQAETVLAAADGLAAHAA